MATIKRTRSTRTRNIVVNSEDTSKDLEVKIQNLMKQIYSKNKEQNKLKREHDKLRTDLYKTLKDSNIDSYDFLATIDDKKSTLVANIETPKRNVVDINKLKNLVDQDTFLAIVKASNIDVEKIAGVSISNQCKIEKLGTENVNVSLRK